MLAHHLATYRGIAEKWHKDQTYGYRPYTAHLDEVLAVCFEFEVVDEDVLKATRFHDALEDCAHVDLHRLLNVVRSPRIAALVWAVTNEPGKNRKIRGKATYPKIAGVPGATTLKLADRIANTRNCVQEAAELDSNKRNKSKWGMYRKEYPAFRKALLNPRASDSTLRMWGELDRLYGWLPMKEAPSPMTMADYKGDIPPALRTVLDGLF